MMKTLTYTLALSALMLAAAVTSHAQVAEEPAAQVEKLTRTGGEGLIWKGDVCIDVIRDPATDAVLAYDVTFTETDQAGNLVRYELVRVEPTADEPFDEEDIEPFIRLYREDEEQAMEEYPVVYREVGVVRINAQGQRILDVSRYDPRGNLTQTQVISSIEALPGCVAPSPPLASPPTFTEPPDIPEPEEFSPTGG